MGRVKETYIDIVEQLEKELDRPPTQEEIQQEWDRRFKK